MNSVFDLGQASIRRRNLLERLEISRPKILALIAPAGFGKSTLARQLIESRVASVVCDCAGVGDELDFARRIVPALAEQEPERGAALAQTELMLADGATTLAQRVTLATAAWRSSPRLTTFVFENAEHVTERESVRDLFARLLAECPENRSVIVCSRTPLRMHLSRFAPPHRILTLRAEDLAFARDEIEEILRPLNASPGTVDRIQRLSQGWPIAVFLLARFFQEGRLDQLVERLDDVAFEDLHDYLADQVLEGLDADIRATLLAATCIPDASREDLVVATGSDKAVERFVSFERTSPFVTKSEAETFVVHPLLATLMLEREPLHRGEVVRSVASRYEDRGDFLRAAELHLAGGSQEDAARTLELVGVAEDHAPSMRYARVLATLDRGLVRRHVTLWACSAVLQMFSTNTQQLYDESTEIWNGLGHDVPPQKRYLIFVTRVLLMTFLGRFAEALRLVEAVVPRTSIDDIADPTLRGYALYLHGLITARMGYVDSSERDLVTAWPLVKFMDILGSAVLMILATDVERVRGNREKERQLLERAIETSLPSELSNIIAQRYAEAAFGAWLAGEDEAFDESVASLSRVVDERGIRGFSFFTDCARRRPDAEPEAPDLLKWIICGHLVAYGDAEKVEFARAHAEAALAAARAHSTPYMLALSALALAEVVDEPRRTETYREAARAAASIDDVNFAQWVAAAEAGEANLGALDHYFQRRVRFRGAPQSAPRIEIELLRGTIRVRGKDVALPERELALVLALARRPEPTSREALTEVLWPELAEAAGRNALHVCLHRLRQRLGDDGAIVRSTSGYRLCDEARVDLWDITRAVTTLRARDASSERDLRELGELNRRLKLENVERFAGAEWFHSVERRVHELRSEVVRRLAVLALERDQLAEALVLAHEIVELDPCDEAAHEIVIAAYLQRGDRAAALRQFRSYRDALRDELQCEPSARLAALVGVSPTGLRA